MKPRSLTRRLVAGVLLAELTCAAGFSVFMIGHEEQERRRDFDIMLRGRADSVLGAVRDAEDPEDNVFVDPAELSVPKRDIYAVLNPDGRELGHSPGAPAALIRELEHSRGDGYFVLRQHGSFYRAVRFVGMRIIDREEQGGLRRPVIVLYASPWHGFWHEAYESASYSIIVSALLLGLTALVLVWFMRRSLVPLQELAAAAASVSVRTWEFSPPNAALETRELAPMAASIRTLLASLRRAFDRQRQFTGDAAHELKTSVAVFKSSLQLLTMRPRPAEEYQRRVRGLLTDVARMEDLVEGMLALARLEEEQVSSAEEVDLASVIRSVAERLSPIAEERQVRIRIEANGGTAVRMPEEDARVLSSNLILNAVQHSPVHSEIVVSLHRQGDAAEMRVTDKGSGIDAEALPHVFDRFYRADRSRSRRSGGAGLGLAICKAIVDRSHGSISIASQPGKGTQIEVRLASAAVVQTK